MGSTLRTALFRAKVGNQEGPHRDPWTTPLQTE
jgi:hypothetical protein